MVRGGFTSHKREHQLVSKVCPRGSVMALRALNEGTRLRSIVAKRRS